MPKRSVNGINLHYWQVGEGPDLVMIHGLNGNLAVWHLELMPKLRHEYRITTYDLRGHGRSDMPPTGYSTEDMAKDLLGLLDALGIERAHLMGHSLGADISLFHPGEIELGEAMKTLLDEVARREPRRVVFDSLSEIRILAQQALRYRRQILALKQHFGGKRCTVLLLDDHSSETRDQQVASIAHGVLLLEQLTPEYGADRRRMRVLKHRGRRFRGGHHDYLIQQGGIRVFPRLVASEHFAARDAEQERIADLAGRAGDRDSHRGLRHEGLRDAEKNGDQRILP